MAKKGHREQIILVSEETGHQYHTTKNKINTPDRVELTKFDPQARKKVTYKEKK